MNDDCTVGEPPESQYINLVSVIFLVLSCAVISQSIRTWQIGTAAPWELQENQRVAATYLSGLTQTRLQRTVLQLVFVQCYQTVRFTISLCRLTGKNNTQKDTVLFYLCIPSSTLQFGRIKKNSGWYKLPNYKNSLKIINDLDNLAPQK